MRIAIIGAGFTGLSAAHKLVQKRHDITVFEKDILPGGLAIGYQESKWDWTLEKHYHHWFTNDDSVLALASEIGHEVLIRRPKTSVYVDKTIYQLDSPVSVLTFQKLSLSERIRMSFVLGFLKFNPYWKPLERYKAAKVLPSLMGEKPYKMLWEPLLLNKFGSYANDVSLAWFWARIFKRTPSLAYPKEGFLAFALALAKSITEKGGAVRYGVETTQVTNKHNKVLIQTLENGKKKEELFDKVIVTLPSLLFLKIAPTLPNDYKESLSKLKSLGAINLVLRLSKPFFPDDTYWLSVCDKKSPVMAVVEHTHFMERKFYNNEHIVYLGNYLPREHRYFQMNEEELLKEYLPYLTSINSSFKKTIVGMKAFKAPFAQPVIPVNYSDVIPPFETPLHNVYLANIDQVYPWDRGTNYAVELGEKVAQMILHTTEI